MALGWEKLDIGAVLAFFASLNGIACIERSEKSNAIEQSESIGARMTTLSEAKKDGFTLIEVLIALTIFSIGILSISGMLIIGAKGIAGGSKSLIAVQAAKAQMEMLRGSVPENPVSDICSTLYKSTIQCLWSVKKGEPAEGLSTIEVITTWYEGERKRELVLTTLRFDANN